jgi:mitotic spindle assembly checkpoint protein MAD2
MPVQVQTQLQKQAITLQGSAQIVAEFFQYAVNKCVRLCAVVGPRVHARCEQSCIFLRCSPRSILYQRGIYPAETFDVAKKYGCNLWLTNDDGLLKYLHTVLGQMKGAW